MSNDFLLVKIYIDLFQIFPNMLTYARSNSTPIIITLNIAICCSEKLGGVHKLRLQEEGVGGQKKSFVNFYTIENVNGGG